MTADMTGNRQYWKMMLAHKDVEMVSKVRNVRKISTYCDLMYQQYYLVRR